MERAERGGRREGVGVRVGVEEVGRVGVEARDRLEVCTRYGTAVGRRGV